MRSSFANESSRSSNVGTSRRTTLLYRPLVVLALFFRFTLTAVAAADRSPAEQALLTGHIDSAVTQLKTALSANPNNGEAHLLLCRAYYAEELSSEAASECDAALRTLGGSSVAQDWAGRAFGQQAGHAGPISGLKLARRVKAAFQTAVSLDPHNGDAVMDLAQYLISAPGIVGGSVDDARALADKVQATMPAIAHRIRAVAADKQHDQGTAEREYRAAIAVANTPGAWVDLALFYSAHHQQDKAVDALRGALAADKGKGPSLVDVASILNDMHREPVLAISSLRAYLASGNQSDDSPVFKAHYLLGKLLAANGDKAEARTEFNAALGLASNYSPAKKALASL